MTSRVTGDNGPLTALQARLDEVGRSLSDIGQRQGTAAEQPAEDQMAFAVLEAEVEKLRSELDGIRTAMISRGVIEQAKGMLMVLLDVDEEVAFGHLREVSNRTNRRLAELAADLVRTRARELRPQGVADAAR